MMPFLFISKVRGLPAIADQMRKTARWAVF